MKRMIITLDAQGEPKECQLHIPNSVYEKIEYSQLEDGVKKIFADILHCDVISIESCEEMRHSMGRRFNDGQHERRKLTAVS